MIILNDSIDYAIILLQQDGFAPEEPEEFMVSLPQSIRVSILMDLSQNALSL